jgi:hypothetical protein
MNGLTFIRWTNPYHKKTAKIPLWLKPLPIEKQLLTNSFSSEKHAMENKFQLNFHQ